MTSSRGVKVKRFLLRYYPPGILVESAARNGTLTHSAIDLPTLTQHTDIDALIQQVADANRVIRDAHHQQIRTLIQRLQTLQPHNDTSPCPQHVNTIRAHSLPLTNIAFNKSGSKFVTASYDRTAKIFDTATATMTHALTGHRNVVYAVAFNHPFGTIIGTAAFDKTVRLWSAETGAELRTYDRHSREVVCLSFSADSQRLVSGGMDNAVMLHDCISGATVDELCVHSAEVIAVGFANESSAIFMSASFDQTVVIWDARVGGAARAVRTLRGHDGDITAASFDYWSKSLVSASADATVKLWDVATGLCIHTIRAHSQAVVDAQFSLSGDAIVTASEDHTSAVIATDTGLIRHKLCGHKADVTRASFNARGSRIITASNDGTARVWNAIDGVSLGSLEGHSDEVFAAAFNYDGDTAITASKDNTARVWRIDDLHAAM